MGWGDRILTAFLLGVGFCMFGIAALMLLAFAHGAWEVCS